MSVIIPEKIDMDSAFMLIDGGFNDDRYTCTVTLNSLVYVCFLASVLFYFN